MLTDSCKSPFYVAKMNPEMLVSVLMENLGKIARIFYPKTVWYRLFDARTDELKQLEGGAEEAVEANPILGWHGIRRSIEEQDVLSCEVEAIKSLRQDGIDNIGIIIPFISTADELAKAKPIFAGIKTGISVDVPSAALDIESFCREGIAYVLINTDILHPLIHGMDKDNGRFAEQHKNTGALVNIIRHVADKCRPYKIETAVAGELCSDAEMVSKFVEIGIDSIVSEPEYVERIKPVIARTERKILLDKLRNK
jgi:pyruvate,water dikinase